MHFSTVCFDLDDTLYSYERYARAGLREAARELETETGSPFLDELYTLYFDEGRTQDTFDIVVDRHGLDPARVENLVSAYHGSSSPLQPYPETEPVLSALQPEYGVGLITDGREGQAKLDRLGISAYFDEVIVTPTIDRSKHDRTVFEQMLDAFGVSPSEAVYVGDDPRVDFYNPNGLGMTTIRLNRGRYSGMEPPSESARADYRIDSLLELLDVIEPNDGSFPSAITGGDEHDRVTKR